MKESKKLKLVYDVKAFPQGLDPGNMVKMWEHHHVVFWDSDKGTKPKVYGAEDKVDFVIVDTKGKEVDLDFYHKEFQDKEFWEKELHNCTHSPTYFWSNYGTSVYPATQLGIRTYLKSIGMSEIVEKDSDKAAKLWEEQKEIVKKSSAHFTIEFLKERKAVIDVLANAYKEKVEGFETSVKDSVRLVDSNNLPLPEKKRIENLLVKIRKLPLHKKYPQYRTKKGKWDTPMLSNTAYGILLEMYNDLLQG